MPGVPTVRTQTIEFAPYPRLRHRTSRDKSPHHRPRSDLSTRNHSKNVSAIERNIGTLIITLSGGLLTQITESNGNHTTTPLYRSETMHTFRSTAHRETNVSFGGFPGPREIIFRFIHRFMPGLHRRLAHTITMPRTTTITSMRGNMERARAVPYVSFNAVVGHNSTFEELTEEQLEELGGVEFRALNALLWIVGIVRFKCLPFVPPDSFIYRRSITYVCNWSASLSSLLTYQRTNGRVISFLHSKSDPWFLRGMFV